MNINTKQYSYQPYSHNKTSSNIMLIDPNRAKRLEYSKGIMMKNGQRPNSYKIKKAGNPSQAYNKNSNSNKYNINYNPNFINKQRDNNYINNFSGTSKLMNYNWKESKKESSLTNNLFNNEERFGNNKTTDYRDFFEKEKENFDYKTRLIYGGRYRELLNDDFQKELNSKKEIIKTKKKDNDNLYRKAFPKTKIEKNMIDYEKKNDNLFLKDYISKTIINNNKYKNEKISLIDNKKTINQIYENNNGINQSINKENNNIDEIENLRNHHSSENNTNNNKIENNFNNKTFKKDIEIIPASSKDYLEEIISENTKHHKSNLPKSKSVNPYKNSTVTEVYQITNSIIGLNNLGATCYMNSALQNIIHCKKLIEKLVYMKNNDKSNKILTNSFLNVCYSLVEKKYSNERNYSSSYYYSLNSFSPSNFKRDFCAKHNDYIRGQHDSIEFLRTLLDDISKEININQNISAYKELTTIGKSKEEQNKEYHTFFIGRENSIIIDTFYIQIINIFTCKCGFESYSFQKFLDIPLLLPMKQRETDLISLIKVYLKEEILDWSAKCEKCEQGNLRHVKKIKFSMLNEIIIFSLQRFDPYYSMKSSINVSFTEYINLKEFCDYDLYKDNTNYRLFGTINHIGNINYGHYYAYVRIGEIWYEFNDSIVRKINSMDFNSSSVCVLFYEKL